MASKIKKLFEKALTNEEVTDLIESMILRIKQYEDNNQIMINGSQVMVENYLMQQEEITTLQAEVKIRDFEIEELYKRVSKLEENFVKEGNKSCKSDSAS